MKFTKIKRDIIESIKRTKKNEEFEVDSKLKVKVQAVASPSFVDALAMSDANRQLVKDRMKEKEKERKELEAQTVERKANETPKTDAMKKMKMVEEFVNASFKDRLTISENIFLVKTTSRAELKTLIENAKKNDVKYSIGRTNEGYEFKYKFEILNESKESRVDVKKCRDIMKNKIDWTDVDASGDVRFAIDQVRSMRSENVISDDEYDYIMSNWDKLQESKKLKEDKKDTDKKADLQKEISWCNSVLNNPKGKAAMDAKANYGKGYVAQVKRDLVRFEKQLKQLDESKSAKSLGLPKEVEVSIGELNFSGDFIDLEDEEISELLGEYLSDKYDFLHFGFDWKGKKGDAEKIICSNIKWDTSESLKEEKLTVEKAKTIAYDKLSYGDYKNLMTQDDDYIIDYVSTNLLRKEYEEKQNTQITEKIDSDKDLEIFDVLGIEEENRKSSKHLIAQYKELEKKFPKASIWLKGDVDIYVQGKVVGETKDLSAVEESKKTIKEGLTDSKYKALIGEHFDHSFDFEFLDIVAHALDRIDFGGNEELSAEDIDDAVNDALIYTADQWTVAKFYVSSPAELDWNDVLEEFSSDISQLAEKITEGTEDEEDEEDEELDRLNHLKDLYDIEPGDLTEDEIKELQDAGMLED